MVYRLQEILLLSSRGRMVVIMDDDDLMLPNRTEVQLAAATVDCGGTYGGWIDYHIDYGD